MGGKSDAPPAPDYKGAAEATGQSSLAAINAQTQANRPNINTPFGSSQWSQGPGGNWTQDVTLDPAAQKALDQQQSITAGRSDIAQGMLGSAGQEMQTPDDFWNNLQQPGQAPTPLDPGALPGRGTGPDTQDIQGQLDFSGAGDINAGGQYNPDFAQTQFDRQMSLMGPQQERAMTAMDTQLRNQGLTPGSAAYDNAMGDLRNQQGEVQSRMQQDAMGMGADEQQRQFARELQQRQQGVGEVGQQGAFANQAQGQQFGQGMQQAGMADQQRAQAMSEQNQQFGQGQQQFGMQNQARQQQIAEQLQREGWSLNKINAMLSGQQVGMPQMPDFKGAGAGQATDYLGAANMGGQYGMQAHQVNQQAAAAPWQALGQIGGGLMGAFSPSDKRLKTNIKPLLKIAGLDFVSWTWNGLLGLTGDSFGFVAQQVQKLYPQFVKEMDNGYLAIDYGGLLEMEAP